MRDEIQDRFGNIIYLTDERGNIFSKGILSLLSIAPRSWTLFAWENEEEMHSYSTRFITTRLFTRFLGSLKELKLSSYFTGKTIVLTISS
jgi:hypothetical protein